MNNKQAIEVLEELKHNILEDLANPVFRDLLKKYIQALDLAIENLKADKE